MMSQPIIHQAMINNYNPHWFVDSIASHHVNGDLNNLALYQGYEGTDHIISGDGFVLPICHLVLHIFPQTLTLSFYLIFYVCRLYNKIWLLFLYYTKLATHPLNFFLLFLLSMISSFWGTYSPRSSMSGPSLVALLLSLIVLCLELRPLQVVVKTILVTFLQKFSYKSSSLALYLCYTQYHPILITIHVILIRVTDFLLVCLL